MKERRSRKEINLPEIPEDIKEFIKKNMEQSFERYGTSFDANLSEEILERKVMQVGNSGIVSIPSKHVGKNVRIFILKEPVRKTEKKKEEEKKKS